MLQESFLLEIQNGKIRLFNQTNKEYIPFSNRNILFSSKISNQIKEIPKSLLHYNSLDQIYDIAPGILAGGGAICSKKKKAETYRSEEQSNSNNQNLNESNQIIPPSNQNSNQIPITNRVFPFVLNLVARTRRADPNRKHRFHGFFSK